MNEQGNNDKQGKSDYLAKERLMNLALYFQLERYSKAVLSDLIMEKEEDLPQSSLDPASE